MAKPPNPHGMGFMTFLPSRWLRYNLTTIFFFFWITFEELEMSN